MSQHTIVFVRHAKSEDTAPGSDEKRPLSDAGRDQAKKLGAQLKDYIENVDTVFVSPAFRASQTWEEMAAGAGVDPHARHVRTDEVLYTGDAMQILEAVRLESSGYTSLVIGHEPTISAAVRLTIREDEADKIARGMATATAAIVTWDRNWKEWHSHVANLADVVHVQNA